MSIKQAIEAWEDRVKPEYPNTDPRTWRSGVSLGFVESHMKNEIDELRAAIAALRSMPQGEPVAWLHTMDNTEGFEENEPWCELTFGEENPFGVPGQDYSESYPVTSVPLFATPHTEAVRMSEAERPSAEWYARMIQETEGLDDALPMGALMRSTPTPAERLAWLHGPDSHNVNGYEWGIFRVKWEGGAAVDVQHTYSDFSDLDAAIEQATAARLGVKMGDV